MNHEEMRPKYVSKNDLMKALNLAEQIEKKALELKREFFEMSKK